MFDCYRLRDDNQYNGWPWAWSTDKANFYIIYWCEEYVYEEYVNFTDGKHPTREVEGVEVKDKDDE
jgi:hypothetical protein